MLVCYIIVMFDHGKCTAVLRGFLYYQRRRHKHHTPALWLPVSGGFAVTNSHRICITHAQAENEGRGTTTKIWLLFGSFSNSSFLSSSESQTSSESKP